MGISTHILDTTRGKPAQGVHVALQRHHDGAWVDVAEGTTNADGRVGALLTDTPAPGSYRIHFAIEPYFRALGVEAFYPGVQIDFVVREGGGAHYHVPLLLNPFGYATYRGS